MFKSATIKLTLWYVLLTMILSLVFSSVLYHFSTHELSEALHSQYKVLVSNDHDSDNQNSVTAGELNDRSQHLLQDLAYFNILVLLGASVASYILARRTLRPIEVAHQAQIRFTAEASHELRTPLAAMRADTESVLMQKKISQTEFRRILKDNLLDIQKLEKLTNHLLELSRYKSQATFKKQPVELNLVMRDTIVLFKQQLKEKNIMVKTTLEPAAVSADIQSLQQLVIIVLDNALKYSRPGGRISVRLAAMHTDAVLTIKDQGIGIPVNDLPHVFEYFFRSTHTAERQKQIEGYGLGLPLAKNIAELHQGSVIITSREGVGTTVTIKLPLLQKASPQ